MQVYGTPKQIKISFEELCARGVASLIMEGFKVDVPSEPVEGKSLFDYIRLMRSQGDGYDREVNEQADYVLLNLKN